MEIHSEEKELIKRAQLSDAAALKKLYEDNFKALFKYVKYKVNSTETAEDIVAEAFTRAFENIGKFKAKSTFKTYVYTIARNLVFEWYKEKGKVTHVEDIDMLPANEEVESNDKSKEVKILLSKLPEKYKKVLEFRFLFNFSLVETAGAMNLTVANIKVIQNRALKKARENLK